MGTDILTEIRAAGLTLSVDGGNLVATPRAAITDELRTLIRTHKAELMAALAGRDLQGISPEFQARLSHEDRAGLASGELTIKTVGTFEQAAIAREAQDLRGFFEERAGILEHDASLPRADAELEAARITATYARNQRYLWASLRAALAGYPVLLAQVPATPRPVDALPLGVAQVHVGKDAKPGPASGSIVITEAEIEAARRGRLVVKQGTFTRAPEVKS